jgi:hypothetical protein
MNLYGISRVDKLGEHAFLSPSSYHWTNYNREKLITTYTNYRNVKLGTAKHEIADRLIKLRIRLPNNSATLNSYVNDAIGWNLASEVVLYYSDNCFGTVDAIGFDRLTNTVRIHDLKTGKSKTSLVQLEVYAALFCLAAKVKPDSLTFILRIYQNDEILESTPSPDRIQQLIDTITEFDEIIRAIDESGV